MSRLEKHHFRSLIWLAQVCIRLDDRAEAAEAAVRILEFLPGDGAASDLLRLATEGDDDGSGGQ